MQNSKIEWCDHSFNPWHGCVKVSPGCQHCYAETLDKRFGRAVWGPAKTTARMEMSADYWKQPLKWDKEARKAGERRRVFCASMADVFEDHPQLEWPRANLWGLIETTPNLDWLLLTKRPENILRMVPRQWWEDEPPANVWYGTSVESQEYADKRIPELIHVPAVVRFLSCEPLLGPVDLSPWLDPTSLCYLNWVICGGESGPGARPMHPDWARSLRDQCQDAGVAFHFKQHGAWVLRDDPQAETGRAFYNVGKHAAGRLLDGRTWDELPSVWNELSS